MTMAIPLSLDFTVERSEPELVAPATPTPYEFKVLSALDDQKGLRKHNRSIHFYPNNVGMRGRDPVKIIKQAIAKTLVHYYPFAGRLREGPNGTLMVECTGEGVIFIEANADVRLEQFGGVPQPPFPGEKELLYDVPGSVGIVHCPLLLIQVTRLICGGFIFALRVNHVIGDATGVVQFMTAVGEIARGANVLSVHPVWKRELITARDPPQVSCLHHVYDELPQSKSMFLNEVDQLAQRSFFFGPKDIEGIRNHVPPHLKMCSKFDMLIACIWRCHTIALNQDPKDEVRVAFAVGIRKKLNPPLPNGFYGNAFGISVALTTAGKLCQNSLGYALQLVKAAKAEMTEEFIRSLVDLLVKKGRPSFTNVPTLHVSDLTHIGFKDIDFGWGTALYGGPFWGGRPASFLISSKNNRGENGIVLTMDLPGPIMESFAVEIEKMITV